MTMINLKHFFNPILDQHSSLSDPYSDLDLDLNNQSYANSASYCNYETVEDLNGRDAF